MSDRADDSAATGAPLETDDSAAAEVDAATDTFTLLSDETRVAIVRTLAAADGPLRFSELRERTGVRDGGRFNYHLQKLRGPLVVKRDDGYALTEEGERVTTLV